MIDGRTRIQQYLDKSYEQEFCMVKACPNYDVGGNNNKDEDNSPKTLNGKIIFH